MTKKRTDNFHGNVPDWISLADLNIDFYTQFVKAWIPFNAWFSIIYKNLYQDREIINELKNSNNPIKDKIMAYLRNDDSSSKEFKSLLGRLHYELEQSPVPSEKNRISFTNIVIEKNKNSNSSDSYRDYILKVDYNSSAPKGTQKVHSQIIEKGSFKTSLDWSQNDWDIEELEAYSGYNNISKFKLELQRRLLNCYKEVNPYKPINLVIKPQRNKKGDFKKPANSIVIDADLNLFFDANIENVAKGLIEILYKLRCILFHGEINPNKENQKIYEQAYYILHILIQVFKI